MKQNMPKEVGKCEWDNLVVMAIKGQLPQQALSLSKHLYKYV